MNKENKTPAVIFAAVIFFAVLAVFLPPGDTVPTLVSDDSIYISDWARLELTWENIIYYFKTPVLFLHSPLVMFSFMVDKLVWGKQMIYGVHVVNALLHAFSAVLFFILLKNLHFFRKGNPSLRINNTLAAITVLFWAIHPQRAESVAWACERKDTLMVFLFLCTALCFVKSFRKKKYDIAGIFPYALSFLCKPMLITFPALAAVFIFCETRGKDFWKKLKYITPYIAIAAAYFVINLTHLGESAKKNAFASPNKILEMTANIGRYFYKTFFPSGLCTHYSEMLPPADALYLLIPLSLLFLLKSRQKNFSLYCLLPCVVMFGIAVVPVSGAVSIGSAIFADRYSYLPSLFLVSGAAFILASIIDKYRKTLPVICIIPAAAILFFAAETRLNCELYRNGDKYIENALSQPDPHHRMLYILGERLVLEKRFDEAETLVKSVLIPHAKHDGHTKKHIETFRNTILALTKIHRGDEINGIAMLDKVIFSKESAFLRDYSRDFAKDTLLLAAQIHLKHGNRRYAAHIFGMISDFYGLYDTAERDFYLGVRAMIRNEYAMAEQYFYRALQVHPENRRLKANLDEARRKNQLQKKIK